MKLLFSLSALMIGIAYADAVELHHVTVRTGTDGLVMAPLTIANAGMTGGLSCNAEFAHWYSAGIATVEPGQQARIELWLDPKTGTVTLLNDKRENLPVERLWCGLSGRAYATRVQIPLVAAELAKGPRALSCALEGASLSCR